MLDWKRIGYPSGSTSILSCHRHLSEAIKCSGGNLSSTFCCTILILLRLEPGGKSRRETQVMLCIRLRERTYSQCHICCTTILWVANHFPQLSAFLIKASQEFLSPLGR
ncbi:hypothetical protein BDZ45DRAFT_348695 [Acephala macrosclerotiorum]|nr:hypothetical protein BDZ45DRAFT_348695 [Acephala macrosclerotiorum]